MTKNKRHSKICELINEFEISTQEELTEKLNEMGLITKTELKSAVCNQKYIDLSYYSAPFKNDLFLKDNPLYMGLENVGKKVYRYIATDEQFKGFGDRIHTGMKLPKETCEDIFYKNFERTVGTEPKKINKAALSRYIAKYRWMLDEKTNKLIDELSEKYL